MIVFLASNALAFMFFLVLVVFAVQGRSLFLLLTNLCGSLSAALSIGVELTDIQTLAITGFQKKSILLILLGLIIAALVVDLVNLALRMRLDSKSKYARTDTWRRVMRDREYKMIFHEDIFKAELERYEDLKMTERLQALQMWRLGNRSFLDGNYDDAIEKYELSVKWAPTSVCWINHSGIFLERANFEKVLECCEEAVKLNPDKDEAWFNRGLAYMALHDNGNALKSFDEALAANSNKPETHTFRGNALRKMANIDQAIESYDKAIQIAPEYLKAWFQKGIALGQNGRLEESVECFRQTLVLDARFSSGYYHLANALNKLDWNEEAIDSYRKALKLRPKLFEAWNNLGIAQSKLGKLKDAIRSYKQAITINPDYQEAWLNQALCYESLKKYDEAIDAYRRFMKITSTSLSKHREIAQRHLDELEKHQASLAKSKKRGRKQTKSKRNGKQSRGSEKRESSASSIKKVQEKAVTEPIADTEEEKDYTPVES